jgi:hypothetical protein
MSATKRVRYTARDMRVRFARYRTVRSLIMRLRESLERWFVDVNFDSTAIATAESSFVVQRACERGNYISELSCS